MSQSLRKPLCIFLLLFLVVNLVDCHSVKSKNYAKTNHPHKQTHNHDHGCDNHNHNHHNSHDDDDHNHFHKDEKHGHDHHNTQSSIITVSQRWIYGLIAGLCVSFIGFGTALMIVCCKNLVSETFFDTVIKFLFSLAFGSLLGDSMIHIIPQVYMSGEGDFRIVGGIFIGSIVFFIVLERIFQSYDITHEHWHTSDEHGESHAKNEKENIKCNQNQKSQQDKKHSEKKNQNKSFWQGLKGKGAAGYLNLLGSFIHNFMDGLALGVAFATGDKKVFVPLFVAIIAHEIPREMGDVAILMTNSFNPTQTVLCNGVINMISLLGVVMGLRITELDDVTKNYVLVFVAGNFIFIAADIWRNLFRNKKIWKNLVELLGIAIGVGMMFVILELEGHDHGHSHGGSHGHGHGSNQQL